MPIMSIVWEHCPVSVNSMSMITEPNKILWKYRLFQHHFSPPAIECLKLGQLDECMNYPTLQLVLL